MKGKPANNKRGGARAAAGQSGAPSSRKTKPGKAGFQAGTPPKKTGKVSKFIRMPGNTPPPAGPRPTPSARRPATAAAPASGSVPDSARPGDRTGGAAATSAPAAVRQETIDERSAGQRIDNFLLKSLKGAPRSLVYRILRSGEVRINGKRAKPEVRVESGDVVRIPPVRIEERDPGQAPAGLLAQVPGWVLHEDRLFLVLNKPSGIAAHGGSGISFGAIELVRQWRPKETFELVHRLDRDTSGVLVLAKRRSGLTALQAVMRENRIEKHYLALLAGELDRDRVEVDVALAKNVLRGGERMVTVDADGKDSLSIFRVIERHAGATFVDVQIKTGRTHQIRVHAQHIGHPILGDDKYGDDAANRRARAFGLKRLFLHAKSFAFSLPDQDYAFTAPLAEDLRQALARFEQAGTAGRD